jgi:hypothetical protein
MQEYGSHLPIPGSQRQPERIKRNWYWNFAPPNTLGIKRVPK